MAETKFQPLSVDDVDSDFDRINEHYLFGEWKKHPQLYRKYAERLVQAKRELADSEDMLAVVEAEADQEIRSSNSETKITEAFIKQQTVLHVRCRKIRKQIIDKQAAVDFLTAIIKTLDNRKTAMEEMVKLEIAGLKAEPKLPKDAEEQWSKTTRKQLRRGL